MADQGGWPYTADPLTSMDAVLTPPQDLDDNMLDDINGKLYCVKFM